MYVHHFYSYWPVVFSVAAAIALTEFGVNIMFAL
jgi:hypothetical protein